MTASGLPFDDFRNLARGLPLLNKDAAERVLENLEGGESLGRLGALAAWFAAAVGRAPAAVSRPAVALFAATHAVSLRLGQADPVADAQAKVEAIASGAAPVSHLCAAGGLGLNVFDLALELPVEDMAEAAALDERAAAATMAFGMEAIASGADLICLGAVNGAGDPSAMALLSALVGTDGSEWAGTEEAVHALIAEALGAHRAHLNDPLEAMRRLGGRETAAIAGAILAARTQRVAVILDGLPATAAAAVLFKLNGAALDHCLLAAARSEPHRQAAARIGLKPLLNLGDCSEGGVAAALAAELVKAGCDISAGMSEVKVRSRGV